MSKMIMIIKKFFGRRVHSLSLNGTTESINYDVINLNGIEFIIRKMSVDKDQVNWMGKSLFYSAFQESSIGQEDIVLDLGAHIGSFAVLAAVNKSCQVFAFEPDKVSFSLLRVNAILNNVENRVYSHCAAVSGKTGKQMLYEVTENWGHTLLPEGGSNNVITGHKTEINCFSLVDAFDHIGIRRCAFLKFNIEGAEFDVFENAEIETFRRINCMVGEIHYDLGRHDSNLMVKRLNEAGFLVKIIPQTAVRALLWAKLEKK